MRVPRVMENFGEWASLFDEAHRSNHGTRPYIELEPTDHPLAVAQREGISVERVAELFAAMTH